MPQRPPPEILEAFGHPRTVPVHRASGGWINDTFIVGEPRDLVIQRVSGVYFTDPEGVMENLVRIIGHLEWRARFSTTNDGEISPRKSQPRWYRSVINTRAGKPYLFDEHGDIWRGLNYIEGRPPQGPLTIEQTVGIASLYGRYLAEVADLTDPPLRRTVDWFRDLDAIEARLHSARATAPAETLTQAQPLIELRNQVAQAVAEHTAALPPGAQRLRPVHNDTKLTNVLLRPTPNGTIDGSVIDLDLSMDGIAAHDFGDLLRSVSQHARAHAGSPDDGEFDHSLFAPVAAGFLAGAGQSLTDREALAFPIAGPRVCLELGTRYLTDFLNPDAPLRLIDAQTAAIKAGRNLKCAAGMLASLPALERTIEEILSNR